MPEYDIWVTHFHVTTCAICAALDGQVFAIDAGPIPPLHQHCHCTRRRTSDPPPIEPPPDTGPPPPNSSMSDDFDSYGGDEIVQSGSDALHWVRVVDTDYNAYLIAYPGRIAEVSADHVTEGVSCAHLEASCSMRRNFSPPADLNSDGRITDSDFITLAVYAASAPPAGQGGLNVSLFDHVYSIATTRFTLQAGWNYLAIKRADFTYDAANWTAIIQILVSPQASIPYTAEVYVDDLRFVAADPDDDATYNDTGDAWNFTGGVWHIYNDLANVAYCLGQIDVLHTARSTAIRQGNYNANNYFSAGLYLRTAGAAGLLAFAIDTNNAYEIKIDSDAGAISLIRWIDGNAYTLATIDQKIDIATPYIAGLQRDGNYLLAYCKPLTNPTSTFNVANMFAVANDVTYLQGYLGFTAYGANVRYFSARAGVLTQLAAEYADRTDPLGHTHAESAAYAAPAGTASRAAFNTESITLQELAQHVKALIDDLTTDQLLS